MRKSCLCILLLLSTLAHAQSPGSQGSVRYLGIENGLSNNAVTQIYQDARGFMWFGTYDGLNRYDGYRFKVCRNRIGDSSSLVDNNVNRIEGAPDGRLWVGGRKGLSVFDPITESFELPRYLDQKDGKRRPLRDNVLAMRAIGASRILVGTEHLGLFVFDTRTQTGTPVALKGQKGYEATAVAADTARGLYWVSVQQQGLCRYDPGTRQLQPMALSQKRTYSLNTDKNGNVWLGTDSGLFRYDIAKGTITGNYLATPSKVMNLYTDHEGVLWIACDGSGILLLGPNESRARTLIFKNRKQTLSSNSVFAIYEDKENRKWIGTLRGGINIIDPADNPFELHTFPTDNAFGQINNFIFSFGEADDAHLWVGTDGAGLRYWNRKTNASTAFTNDPADKSSIGSNFITSILRDSHQKTWVGTWFGGVSQFQIKDKKFKRYICYNPLTKNEENNIWLVYEDRNQRLWVSTSNNGTLYLYNPKTDRFEAWDPAGLSNLQCLTEDSRGDFWGGSYTALVRIDRVSKRHKLYPTGYPVRCLREDAHGNFWVGTDGGGLLLFDRDREKFTRYTDADGLSSNAILQMLEDREGNLWMSTFNGLDRFDTRRRTARNFMQGDGLQSNQFSYKAVGELRSGEFVFGGIRGFNIFFPDSVRGNTEQPPLRLTGIRVNNEPVSSNVRHITEVVAGTIRGITVPYEENTVSVDYAALDYTSADKIAYSYKLDGWDKAWLSAGDQRTATYTRLPEGQYTLLIKNTNASGEWGTPASLLRITVLPPWFRTWWAYLLYGLSFISLVGLYVNYARRQERLKYEVRLAHLENEKEKEIAERKFSYFTHISHEFRTPLTLIINPLKQWIRDNEPAAESGGLTTAYRNARRLLSLVDQLLLFRKADSRMDELNIVRIDMTAICREVHALFLQQARARRIDYRLEAPLERVEIPGDFEKIEIALFNLLSNAFKFTPEGGTVVFRLESTKDGVLVIVEDSGCGIDEKERPFIFDRFRQGDVAHRASGFGIGLFLVKHFVEAHQGRITFDSAPGTGTTFRLTLPGAGVSEAGDSPIAHHELLDELAAETDLTPLPENNQPLEGRRAEELVSDRKSILVIDDNPDILAYLRGLFETRYVVLGAASGEDGLTLAERQLPDLILSDVQMAGMDGITLCARIKSSETLGHIPVILLTASTGDDTRLRGLEGGADDYITKPFDAHLLLAKIDSVLRNRNLLQKYFFDSITLKESSVRVPSEYRHFLAKCIQVVEDNIDNDDFTIKTFSKAMGMSHRALYHKIKSISGQSAVAFIRQIRLRRSAVLMLREDMNINQAAFQVGIGDVRYFREQFVKTFGVTPSEYIRKYRPLFNRDLTIIAAPPGDEG
ncbi:MAG TPA: two-component regulator propeller domain-containing protein [Dinghuibacter sp.]|uniref:hybrid sensor histidine kinase/response regulator transcription factor n=1 Tax=Dinghuibacter sp. TaxID=2024697 RepID=UPI002CF0E78B|nr:two-component regulator propeller domain-containing protein [Dinghuibacter sp.]HTJ13335.1 two-component regulator propeller domain-containing protein [Dinghuibacter sp.]